MILTTTTAIEAACPTDVTPADDAKALENDDIEKEAADVTVRTRSRSKRRRHHFLLLLRYYNHCNRNRLAYECDAGGQSRGTGE